MEITVKKPNTQEIEMMEKCPVWSCEPSTFDWFYDSEETCLILEGEVTVTFDGGSVSFGAGDLVMFPKGLACVWHVKKAVKKHYFFK